jgi:hypothetical protein
MASKRALGLIVGAAALIVLAVLVLYTAQREKPHPPATPQQAAQNECTLKAYQDYLKDQASRPTDVENCFRWKAPLRSDDCKNAFVFSSSSV